MKTITAILATVVTFAAGQGLALTPEEIAADLQEQGYQRIEIRLRANTIKAEAIRGNEKLEVIYDASTGTVLKTEVEPVEAGEDTTPGVTIRTQRSGLGRAHAEDHRRNEGGYDGAEHDQDDDHGGGRGRDDRADDDRDEDHDHGRGRGRDRDDEDDADDDNSEDDHDDDGNDDDDDNSDDDDSDDDQGGRRGQGSDD